MFKNVFAGYAAEPAKEAYSAPPDPLAGFGGSEKSMKEKIKGK